MDRDVVFRDTPKIESNSRNVTQGSTAGKVDELDLKSFVIGKWSIKWMTNDGTEMPLKESAELKKDGKFAWTFSGRYRQGTYKIEDGKNVVLTTTPGGGNAGGINYWNDLEIKDGKIIDKMNGAGQRLFIRDE